MLGDGVCTRNHDCVSPFFCGAPKSCPNWMSGNLTEKRCCINVIPNLGGYLQFQAKNIYKTKIPKFHFYKISCIFDDFDAWSTLLPKKLEP